MPIPVARRGRRASLKLSFPGIALRQIFTEFADAADAKHLRDVAPDLTESRVKPRPGVRHAPERPPQAGAPRLEGVHAAAAERKVANLETELDKARGLLRKCQDMFDVRNAELQKLRADHSEDHNQVVAHQKEIEAMKAWSEEAKGQMQGRRPASSAFGRRGDGAELGRLA